MTLFGTPCPRCGRLLNDGDAVCGFCGYGRYPKVPGHVAGSDTSEEAAERMRPGQASMQMVALRLLAESDDGLTSDELEQLTGWRHQTASARLRELVLAGWAVDSDERRKTSSGSRATVRRITDKGREAVR